MAVLGLARGTLGRSPGSASPGPEVVPAVGGPGDAVGPPDLDGALVRGRADLTHDPGSHRRDLAVLPVGETRRAEDRRGVPHHLPAITGGKPLALPDLHERAQ